MLRRVPHTPLGALSCFSTVLVFGAGVYPSISPVGHWVSVTVNTNMLWHAFDPLRLANTATCCSLLVQQCKCMVCLQVPVLFFKLCRRGGEKLRLTLALSRKNRKLVFPAKLLIHIRRANVTPSQSQLHPAQKRKTLHILLGCKVHLRVQVRKK